MKQHPKTIPFSLSNITSQVLKMTEEQEEWTRSVRALNDAFRLSFTSTELYTSPQILDLDIETQSKILDRVRNYRTFNEENDPDCTHRWGCFQIEDQSYVWEIFCLNSDGKDLSDNPLDLNLTRRHIMIMCEDEYWEHLPKNDS